MLKNTKNERKKNMIVTNLQICVHCNQSQFQDFAL